MNTPVAVEKPPFRQALRFWWKLGWISFGGTAAHIAIMHDYLVERKQWIDNDAFLHALSHCMLLPGPEAQQLAIYIGWKLHGIPGGLIAGWLFVLPSMFVLLALSILYVNFGNLPWIAAMFAGLKPAVLALILLALHRVARRSLQTTLQWIVAAAAFAAMFFFDVPLPLIMLCVVVLGIFTGRRQSLRQPQAQPSTRMHTTGLIRRTAILISIALGCWLLPWPLLYLSGVDFRFWRTLSLFFTKAAFVTVGGSYTVIPYVAQSAVGHFHWLSRSQMTDGFALAETTPGPLIIVVAFVGFLAAWNHFGHSLWMGTLGLLLTTFYTFLPCFLFVFAGAPLVEQTHNNPAIKNVLRLITAVVVGAMLYLAFYLGRGIVFLSALPSPRNIDIVSVAWVLAAILLLRGLRMNVLYLVLLSLAFGAGRYCVATLPLWNG